MEIANTSMWATNARIATQMSDGLHSHWVYVVVAVALGSIITDILRNCIKNV
jgi:hypothetical protein